jgi:O-antigen/teichoic acid export membrane protein
MARHSIGTLLVRLFGIGCGFLYAVAVARLLGPHGYGIVAVAASTATLIATVSVLGTSELAVRETAALSARKAWSELRNFVRWSQRTVLFVSIMAGLLMACASLVPGPYAEVFLLGSAAVPLLAMQQVLKGVIQGSGNVIVSQLPTEVVRWVITFPLLALLFFDRSVATPVVIILLLVTALAFGLATSALHLRRLLRMMPRGGDISGSSNKWFVQTLPFLAVALFGIVGTEIGTLLVGIMSGPREAGLYQPIAKLAPLMVVANSAIEAALAPRIVHSWEDNDKKSLQRRVSRSARTSAVATAVIVVIIVAASPYILGAFGPEFTRYQQLVVWVGLAQVVNAATGAAPLLLAMTGDMKRRIGAQAVTMIVQAGLGLALIPPFGAVGAVASLTVSILVWSFLHWWLALRTTGIDTSLFGGIRPFTPS